MKILIIEDEAKTAAYLKNGLEENGFVADVAADGETSAYVARQGQYDPMILDVVLPGKDGWPVLKELCQRRDETPVLFLTVRDAVADRVHGLELGADDGLRRTSILAALGNAVVLLVVTGGIAWEGVRRLFDPKPSGGVTIMVVAAVGIAVNGITAGLFMSGR